jgi:hypothetical protein
MLYYHIETHYPRLTTLARALLKSDTVRNVFLYGLGLSPTVTPVADVCGKERPYKLYGRTSEIRTRDQWIKSPLLYRLSYSPVLVSLDGIEPPFRTS